MTEGKRQVANELRLHHCLERVDSVPNDSEATAFKRCARLHQARWRVSKQLAMGTEPIRPKKGRHVRGLGSRLSLSAIETGANFLDDEIRHAVWDRINTPERYQMINKDRLLCDLLSSMPMCFNLFGHLSIKPEVATRVVRQLWPDTPDRVSAVRFEWSPGRRDFRYLGNQSAFDVAFQLELDNGGSGIIGVETKYHEHCERERQPSKTLLDRYLSVTDASDAFKRGAKNVLVGSDLQQIWADHLLALSMLQHDSGTWRWVKFVLVYPEKNTSFSKASSRYAALLDNPQTFASTTVEAVLESKVLPTDTTRAFRERYLWQEPRILLR